MSELYEPLKHIVEEEMADGATDESLARGAAALDTYRQNCKHTYRSGTILGVVMFLVGLACVMGADYVADIWAKMMLVVGGVCAGGVAMVIVVVASLPLELRMNKKKEDGKLD